MNRNIAQNITELLGNIGNIPLVKLNKFGSDAEILLKLEYWVPLNKGK